MKKSNQRSIFFDIWVMLIPYLPSMGLYEDVRYVLLKKDLVMLKHTVYF